MLLSALRGEEGVNIFRSIVEEQPNNARNSDCVMKNDIYGVYVISYICFLYSNKMN